MRKLLTGTRVANVLALLALFIALGGTSYGRPGRCWTAAVIVRAP
jgi:hypothetical protein